MLDERSLEVLQEEFETLWFANHEVAYRYTVRIVGSSDTAHDIVQEASVRAWRAFSEGKFDPERTPYSDDPVRAFRVWFIRIVHNLCYDHLKSIKRALIISIHETLNPDEEGQEFGDTLSSGDPSAQEMVEREEFLQLVRQAVNGLPNPYRDTFRLLLKGKTYEQIAEIQGIELGTVRSRIARARKLIQQFFETHHADYIEEVR